MIKAAESIFVGVGVQQVVNALATNPFTNEITLEFHSIFQIKNYFNDY